MYIWKTETAAEKKAAQKQIDELNAIREKACRERWEIETAMRRLNLRRKPGGRAPQ